MQLNLFNGGLNTRIASHLLQTNETPECENVDIASGELKSIKEDKHLNAPINQSMIYFKDRWVSFDDDTDFTLFQQNLFKSNGVEKPQVSLDGYRWFNLGIDSPKDAPHFTSTSSVKLTHYEQVAFDAEISTFDNSKHLGTDHFDNEFGFSRVGRSRLTGGATPLEISEPITIKYKLPYTLSGNTVENARLLPLYALGSLPLSRTCGYIDGQYYVSMLRQSNKFPIQSESTTTDADLFRAGLFRQDHAGVYRKINYDGTAVAFPSLKPIIWSLKNTLGEEFPSNVYMEWERGKTYHYAFHYVENDTGAVSVETLDLTVPEDINVVFFGWKFKKPTNHKLRIFRDGKECNLYENDNWLYDNKVTTNVGIESLGLGYVSYAYTYYSEITGAESQPSPASVNALDKVDAIYLAFKPSDDQQVTHIKIYRTGLGKTKMSLVAMIPADFREYVDLLSTNIDGALLNSWDNNPAPKGLHYITSTLAMLFGAVDSKLFFTDIAKPFVWNPLNYIVFDDTITGLGETPNGLLVFTRHKTYIVTGNSPSTFSKFVLSSNIGCRLHKSIQTIKNTLIWLSDAGICMSNGGVIENITRNKLRDFFITTPRCSAVLHDVYYLSHANGTLIMDFRTEPTLTHLSSTYLGLRALKNSLYACKDGELFELFKGDNPCKLVYKTPDISDGSISNLKIYKQIYTYISGEFIMRIYLDNKLVLETQLQDGFNEIKLPSESSKGFFISFELLGKGSVKEIEYKVEGRQNGR